MCMNRRAAKVIAEQIGMVIEIPVESKECLGKFLRVKVHIDISNPLKRFIRLGVKESEKAVIVPLIYERLPEFCYACGRIEYGLHECSDDKARTEALEGSSTKFGPWMRVEVGDRSRATQQRQMGKTSFDSRNSVEPINEDLTNLVGHAQGLGDTLEDLAKQGNVNAEQVQELQTNSAMEGVVGYFEVTALEKSPRANPELQSRSLSSFLGGSSVSSGEQSHVPNPINSMLSPESIEPSDTKRKGLTVSSEDSRKAKKKKAVLSTVNSLLSERLDHFLVDEKWLNAVNQVSVEHLGFYFSDQCPLLLKFGDKNSKFFHRRAFKRKKKNLICKLWDGNGNLQESKEELSQIIVSYFSSLFQSLEPSPSDIRRASELIIGRLNTEY
ncbi:hypothetical protein EZV62_000811 [Acer yangbiense]|uniref:Zinc knuckle CX2CX4HX4C domain-containing protein n=1 Tax=Acer yangbiense TaxID=1000413 RepID=A0A5C7IUM4_9ROSI|nr:hypothetical protein EZV62_000811 [Acer yangbiense]